MKNSFKNMTFAELIAKREELIKKLYDLRVQLVVGQVSNALEKRMLRRQIARLHTLIYNHDEVKE